MIDEKLQVELGGLKQTIHIKGNNDNNPVLLFLHGGPGVSNRHSVVTTNDDLLDDFTIVAWDQRGTGGSYYGCARDSLTVGQLTKDASELATYLCKRFNKKKIFAIGGSWGSLLGVNLIKEYPDNIAAFIGFGQYVDGTRNEAISYQFSYDEATKANDVKALKKLDKIGKPVNGIYRDGLKGMMVQRKVMMKYGGYSKSDKKRSYSSAMIKPILKSHEYSFKEIIGLIKGYKFVLTKMWDEVASFNLNKTDTEFKVPFFILDGRLDKNTPAELVEEWYNKIKAPVKELVWFENSGHNPLSDEGEKFKAILKDRFLKIAKKEGL